MSWYKVEKYDDCLYVITEDKHWEKTNIYYLIGKERNLLIDTGTGIKPLKALLEEIDKKPIDVLITHGHWDHLGNVHEFDHVFVHEGDLGWVRDGLPLPEEMLRNGLIKDVEDVYLRNFKMPSLVNKNVKSLDGFTFDGLSIIHTPGHSPGSVCIYDQKRQILFSGDTLYEGTIYCHFESTDPKDLYQSIKKLRGLNVNTILSGHYNRPDTGCIEILEEIMHELDLNERLAHGNGLTCKHKICLQL